MDDSARVTSELLWRGSFIVALIDAPLLWLVGRCVSVRLFARLKWHLAGAAFAVYAALWGVFGSAWFWDAVYGRLFPPWSRWILPAGFGAVYGALAILFWRAGVSAGRWPAVWFCALGGLASLLGHGLGIMRGLLAVPILSQASAASALVFGVFEFILYWCAIVGIATAAWKLGAGARRLGLPDTEARA